MHPSMKAERPAPDWPPRQVRVVCETFLELADEAAPGLVEGLYLHGSIGFGEWYAGRSDVDYVAVLSRDPDDATTETLRDVHARLAETFPTPPYDGFHLSWRQLATSPYQLPDLPATLAGEFREGRNDVHPVTWHELADHGVRIRGPRLEDVEIWTDRQALRAYTHANLRSYWAEQAKLLRRHPDEAANPATMAWFVLGAPRLHHLLATDRLTSKNGAGRHVVDAFGERWRPLVAEALAHRATGERAGALSPQQLAEQTADLTDLVVARGLAIEP